MLKKKSFILCVILSLMFVQGLFTTSYAFTFSDVEDFEEKYTQVINNAVKDKGYNEKYNAFKNLLLSQIWQQYKNNIHFSSMNNCIVRLQYVSNSNKFRIDIFLWNYETTYKVIQGGILRPNANISMDYAISFFCDFNATNYTLNWERYNDWDWNTDHSSFNVILTQNSFSLVFIDASIQNDYNYEIVGKNYTIYVIVPNTTTTLITNVGQYRLGEGFIGNYYYNDRQNISYLVYDNNNNTIPLNEIDYTQVTQGYTTKLYIDRENIISGNTYYIDIYYNNELIQQYGYGNTLIFDIPQGESGDENIIIDLSQTNQKIDNIANIIESGNKEIIATLESGNNQIIDALTDSSIQSGEEPTSSDLPSIEIEDISEDFFTWLLNSIIGVLNNNNNTYIDIPVYGQKATQRVYSNVFIMNIEPLKTFISLGWWFICGVPFLKFIRRTIEKLKGGEVPQSDEKSDLLGNVL